MGRATSRREITDPVALRALAHPVRLALLGHLMAFGPRTASQCAEVVGASPSNCSYHLRLLARFGLVEPADADDGRERPWRAAATGFSFGSPAERAANPAVRTAEQAISSARLEEDLRLAHALLDRSDRLAPEWREANNLSDYALRMSAAELLELNQALDRLIRPFIALTRDDAPDDAEAVHVSIAAFRHPDTL
jgi:DNA-binding transcriptional ArsR family regulator